MSNFALHDLQIEYLPRESDRRYLVQITLSHAQTHEDGRVYDDFLTQLEIRLDSLPATTSEEWVNWALRFLAEKSQ